MSPPPVLDLLVVGGGPAGLATAIRARQTGLTVRLVDRARPPIDKPCGEGLMPDALERLAELGVHVPRGEGSPLRGIRYLDGDLVADGAFPGTPGLGLRRTLLHRALAARAEEVGVELEWGARATGLAMDGARGLVGATVVPADGDGEAEILHLAHVVVGADGLRSRVREWAGFEMRAPAPDAPGSRFGVRRHFRVAPWSDRVEVYWGEGIEAYVTPIGNHEVGIAILWSGPLEGEAAGFDSLLARFPELAARVAAAPATSSDRGCGPLSQRPRGVTRGRIALVGDASGYLDAITGEGLGHAFHEAFALVAAVDDLAAGRAADLTPYERAHRRLRRLPEGLIRALLFVERRPTLRHKMIAALADDPALFGRLLGLHTRTLSPRQVGMLGMLRLVRRLAAA